MSAQDMWGYVQHYGDQKVDSEGPATLRKASGTRDPEEAWHQGQSHPDYTQKFGSVQYPLAFWELLGAGG